MQGRRSDIWVAPGSSSSSAGIAISDTPGDILYQWRLKRRLEQARREAAISKAKLQSGRQLVVAPPCEVDNCHKASNSGDENAIPKELLSTSSGKQYRAPPSGGLKNSCVSPGALPSELCPRCDQEVCRGCCSHSVRPPQPVSSHTHWSCDVFPCQRHHPSAVPCLSNQLQSNTVKKGCCCSHDALQESSNLHGGVASPVSKRTGRGPPTGNVSHSHGKRANVLYPKSLPAIEPALDLTSTSDWCSSPSPVREDCPKQPSDQGVDHNLLSQVQNCHFYTSLSHCQSS